MTADWRIYAIIVFLGYGLGNSLVKEATLKKLKPEVFLLHSYAISTLMLGLFLPEKRVSGDEIIYGLLSGVLVAIASLAAYLAVENLGGVTVFPIVNLSYVISLFYGYFMLREHIDLINIGGLMLAGLSLILVSQRPIKKSYKGFLFLLLGFLGYGITDVIIKTYYINNSNPNPIGLAFVINLIVTIYLLTSALKTGSALEKPHFIAFLNGLLLALATFSLIKAMNHGPVSLVSPIVKLNTVIPVVYSVARGESPDKETIAAASFAMLAILLLSV